LKESSDGETLTAVGIIIVPDLWSSRGESTTFKVGFTLGTRKLRGAD